METRLHFEILPQPDDFTCGPTCLHAVYRYYDLQVLDPTWFVPGAEPLTAKLAAQAAAKEPSRRS